MIESLLQEATDALLAQQDEIARLHRIIAWCRYRVPQSEKKRVDSMLLSAAQPRQTAPVSGRGS